MKQRRAFAGHGGSLALLVSLLAFGLSGCGHQVVLKGTVRLRPGQQYRLAESAAAKDLKGLERTPDGLRLPRWGQSQPAIPASTAATLSWRLAVPGPVEFQTGFGLLPSEGKEAGATFVVRTVSQGVTHEVLRQEVTGALGEGAIPPPTRLSLSGKAGEEIELQFSVESSRGQGSAVWINPIVSAPASTRRPNVILVLIDALRADHLGCYGSPRGASPGLDELAAGGVVFDDVSSHATWTLASTLDILTSSYPLVRGYSQDLFQKQPGGAVTPVARVDLPISLPSEMRRLGYRNLGSVGGGFIDASFGFGANFDWYWSPPPDREVLFDEQLSILQQRLAAETPAPFFLLLHTYEVHNYLRGNGHHLRDFDHGYTGPLKDRAKLFQTVASASAAGLTAADQQYLRDLYDGELRCADRSLAGFLTWVRAQPWGKDTIVAATADHGELFGEHGMLNHGVAPYRQLTHVPLIISLPDQQYHGRRVAEEVGHIDLAPTLLDLAGGKAPSPMIGRSLVPLMAGRDDWPVRPLLTEGRRPGIAVRQGRWAYISWLGGGREELYDVVADPEEQTNLASRAADLARMRRALAEEVVRAGRGYRLVITGPRPQDMTVQLESDAGFNYFLFPTARRRGAIWGSNLEARAMADRSQGVLEERRLVVTIPAGDTREVLLFEGADPGRPVRISAEMGGAAVPASRYCLGAAGWHPSQVPLAVSARAASGPAWTKAPTIREGEWGLWLWLLDTPTGKAPGKGAASSQGMPEDIRRQLKALGYTD